MENIKAIFFDADGTLIDHKECEKQALSYLFNHIGLTYQNEYQDIFRPLDAALWASEKYDGVPVPGIEIPVYRFKVLFQKIGIGYDDYANANELFMTGLASAIALMGHAYETIKCLYEKKYLLCVATNGLIKLQKPRVINTAIGRYISHIIVSEEVGANKPNPLIFETLLKKVNLSPYEVIMVGDSLRNDIQGALNMKIKSVWFNPGRQENTTGILPDYEIFDLLQLTEML
jgi:YjjG family noncanonical pyrimidine nucleotidase